MGYADQINWNYKYQTLKTLERYACNMRKYRIIPQYQMKKS